MSSNIFYIYRFDHGSGEEIPPLSPNGNVSPPFPQMSGVPLNVRRAFLILYVTHYENADRCQNEVGAHKIALAKKLIPTNFGQTMEFLFLSL